MYPIAPPKEIAERMESMPEKIGLAGVFFGLQSAFPAGALVEEAFQRACGRSGRRDPRT